VRCWLATGNLKIERTKVTIPGRDQRKSSVTAVVAVAGWISWKNITFNS
jgi:hypothetical protein